MFMCDNQDFWGDFPIVYGKKKEKLKNLYTI